MLELDIPPARFPGTRIPHGAYCMVSGCPRQTGVIVAYGCDSLHVFGAGLCTYCWVHAYTTLTKAVCKCPRCSLPISEWAAADFAGTVRCYSWEAQ